MTFSGEICQHGENASREELKNLRRIYSKKFRVEFDESKRESDTIALHLSRNALWLSFKVQANFAPEDFANVQLGRDLGVFFNSGALADVIIECGDYEVPAHKTILAARCEVTVVLLAGLDIPAFILILYPLLVFPSHVHW